MLRQQRVLPLLELLRLFSQTSSTLQLTLADLLDVNLVRSLGRFVSIPTPTDETTMGNTYVGQAESTQPSPSLGQELILGQAFRSKGLHSAVDDLKCH